MPALPTLPALPDLASPPPGQLIELAPELLELILSFLKPADLASFARTCRRASAFIRPNNHILWRAAFLHLFDDPAHAWALLLPTARAANRPREASWDWYAQLKRRLRAYRAVCDQTDAALLLNPEPTVTALLDVLDTASYSTLTRDGAVSLNLDYLDRLFRVAPSPERIVHDYHRDLKSASLPRDLLVDPERPMTRSMLGRATPIPEWASRFHVFYGMTEREEDSSQSKAGARAIVYDWNVTGEDADFGPFVKDGSGNVDWKTLEAISSLMHRIFDIAPNSILQSPCGFRNSIPNLLPVVVSAPHDWAGVTRTWVGTYAFLDYRALVQYNFANANLEYTMDLGGNEEACGDLMRLELRISDSKELHQDHRLQSDLPYCKDRPKLYFKGTSRGRPSSRPPIQVRGAVWLVPSGRQVHWRFIISYAGADQWQLEGAQPGGIRSGAIYGLWSHVDHDEHGPMGPFYYAPFDLCEPPMFEDDPPPSYNDAQQG